MSRFRKFFNGQKTVDRVLDGSGILPETDLPKQYVRELKAVMKEYDDLRKKLQMAQEKLNHIHKKIMEYEISESVQRAVRDASQVQ